MYDYIHVPLTNHNFIHASTLFTGTAGPNTGGSPSDSASPSTTKSYQGNTATDASTHVIIQGKGTNRSSMQFTIHFHRLLFHHGIHL